MNKGSMNSTTNTVDPIARLNLTIESFELVELITRLTEENASLDRMLEIAHIEAKQSKKQIAAMSHFNSHSVRGALTRIWGLSNVIKQSNNMEEIHKMVGLLHKEASSLDEVIRVVNAKLNTQTEAS